MDSVIQILKDTFSLLALPKMTFIDIVEIFIIAFSLYHIIFWVKKTRFRLMIRKTKRIAFRTRRSRRS